MSCVLSYYKNLQNLSQGDISLLKDVHVNSSGLKALTTAVTSDAIEVCRKCCGGHGYSRFSGLIDLYGNYVPACTYEGTAHQHATSAHLTAFHRSTHLTHRTPLSVFASQATTPL